MDNKQHSTMIPEEKDINEVSPIIVPAYCLESFQVTAQGREIKQSPGASLI